jgi:hypothetical protein
MDSFFCLDFARKFIFYKVEGEFFNFFVFAILFFVFKIF